MAELFTAPLILFAVGLAAGTLNVIAGGGSLLTIPVMIFLGLPPTVANGTNRIALIVQNVGAVWRFRSGGYLGRSWLLLALPPAVLGGVVGTLAGVRIGEVAFERILALVLIAAAAWTIWHPLRPPEDGDPAPPAGGAKLAYAGGFFLIGLYGGFIQAGVGFVILAVTSLAGMNLIRANALKVTIVLAYLPLSLALYAWNGKVDWIWGLSLAVGNFLGALLGVRLQILKGHAWVRGVVTATIVVFALRLLVGG